MICASQSTEGKLYLFSSTYDLEIRIPVLGIRQCESEL